MNLRLRSPHRAEKFHGVSSCIADWEADRSLGLSVVLGRVRSGPREFCVPSEAAHPSPPEALDAGTGKGRSLTRSLAGMPPLAFSRGSVFLNHLSQVRRPSGLRVDPRRIPARSWRSAWLSLSGAICSVLVLDFPRYRRDNYGIK